MAGQKRDCRGDAKAGANKNGDASSATAAVPARSQFTPMFENFRDELDRHHDRRERIIKASRDITALSKKIIFSLQRVRKIQPDLPPHIDKDIRSRLAEISRLLSSIAPDVQGTNRYRYSRSLRCIEELIEALTFAHYLRYQTMPGYELVVQQVAALSRGSIPMDTDTADPPSPPPTVHVTEEDYLMGIFDLSGEMMRFATVVAALNGKMAGAATPEGGRERTILADMQHLGSLFETLPQQHNKSYQGKLGVLRESVLKVERLGYGLTVRGSERPAGWVPNTVDELPESDD